MRVPIILVALCWTTSALAAGLGGQVEKLTKVGEGREYCGEYFVGATSDNPATPVRFSIQTTVIHKGVEFEMVAQVPVTKKDIRVVLDESRETPWAEVIPMSGFAEIRVYLSSKELERAPCLQRMPT